MTTYVSDRDEVSVKNNFNQNSVIFGLFVNFIALYLFFETAIFYYMAIIFGVLTIISIAMNMVSTEKIDNSIQKRYRTKPTDILKLFSKHMSINKKSITVILLGMIISVIILSQSILMVSSYNQKVIEDNLDVENVVAFELSSNFNYEQSTIQSWKSKVDVQSTERLSQYGLEFKNSSQSSSMSLSIITGGIMSDDYGSYIISTYARAHNYSIDIYNILNQLPTYNQTFDYNPSDTLVILSPWDNSTNFIGKNEMNILLEEPYKESNTTTTFKNMTLPYTHVWQLSEVDINYLMQKNLQIDFYSSLILLPEVQFWDLASIFYTELTTNQRFYYDIITINRIYMNTPLIIDTSYDEIMSGLEKFTNNMINWANQQVSGGSGNSEPWFGGAYGNSPLLLKMYEFQENYLNIAKIMMLILYPLILLSIYFVFFLLTLTDNQRKKQIAILKSRGITDTQLYFIMFFEIIIGMILSIIIGMELSKYWTDYSLNSLEFSNAKYKFENVNLIIPSSWYYKVPILTAIFSFDLHILSVSTIMNVKIQEGEDAFERKPPFWQRFHLDKIIFIASVAFWSMLNFAEFSDPLTLYNLTTKYGGMMIFGMLFGATLLFSRYFAVIMEKTSTFIWNIQKGIVALGTINIKTNKFTSSKLASIFLLSITISFISLTIPNSYVEWGIERARYELGADIYVDGIDTSNMTVWNYLNVSGVEAYTEVMKYKTSPYWGDFGYSMNTYSILGINRSNFIDAAYWKSDYNTIPLEKLVDEMNSNTSIAVNSQALELLDLDVGNSLTISGGDFQSSFIFDIVTDFNLFPNLVFTPKMDNYMPEPMPNDEVTPAQGIDEPYLPEPVEPAFTDIPILMDITAVKTLDNVSQNQFVEKSIGAYVKVVSEDRIDEVATALREVFSFDNSIKIISVNEMIDKFIESDETKVIVSSLESILIICSIINLIAVYYFTFTSMSYRNKEIGLYRALGMKRWQIFKLLIIEGMLTLILSIIISTVLGILVSLGYFSVITGTKQGTSIPPLTLIIPWKFIGMAFSTLIAIMFIAATIPALILSKKEARNILREV